MGSQSTLCWAKATACPVSLHQSTNKSQLYNTCDAWYRCDQSSNYIIQWRCSSGVQNIDRLTPVTEFTLTTDTKYDQKASSSVITDCGNVSYAKKINQRLCPPPIVCPRGIATGLDEFQVAANNVIDVDLILATVLSIVALIICIVAAVMFFKYWMIRWRYRQKFPSKQHRPQKDKELTVSANHPYCYYWDGFNQPIKMKGNLDISQRHSNILVPASKQHHEALPSKHFNITVNNDRVNNHATTNYPMSPKGRRSGQIFGDRSVSTGSFVYQSNNLKKEFKNNQHRVLRARNHNESFSPKISLRSWMTRNNKSNYRPNSFRRSNEYFQTRFLRKHDRDLYIASGNDNNNHISHAIRPPTRFMRSCSSDSSNNSDAGVKSHNKKSQIISSIYIPTYENSDKGGSNVYSEIAPNRNPYNFKGRRLFLFDRSNRANYLQTHGDRKYAVPKKPSSSASTASIPCTETFCGDRVLCCPETNGVVSGAASVASQNWRYTDVISKQQYKDESNRYDHHLTRMKTVEAPIYTVIKNTGSNSSSSHASPSTPNSPDVVSSHNLSRPLSHITHISSSYRDGNSPIDTHIIDDYVARISISHYNKDDYHNKRYNHQNHIQQSHQPQHHHHDQRHSNNINTFQGFTGYIANKYNIPEHVHISEDSSSCSSEFGNNKNNDGFDNRSASVDQELSYDCFRNDYIRQLSRQSAKVSTSTLDKAVGNFTNSTKSFRLISYNY